MRLRLFVDVLDQPRELERRRPHGTDRLFVVHPQRPQQADGAERACLQPVGRADVGDVVYGAAADLGPDANDGSAWSERLAEELEHGRPALEELQQALARLQLGPARLAQQARRAADVEAGRLLGREVEECRAQHLEKPPLPRTETLVGETPPQAARAETEPDDALVQIL